MLHFRSIRWRIALPYLLLILGILFGLAYFVDRQVRSATLTQLQDSLADQTAVLASNRTLRALLASTDSDAEQNLQFLVEEWSRLLDLRVTLIAIDGSVLADTDADSSQMENHGNRPEIRQALAEGQGNAIRFSRTLGNTLLYYALPVPSTTLFSEDDSSQASALLRLAIPLAQVDARLRELRIIIAWGAVLATGLAALLAIGLAERIARPIRRLTDAADEIAQGRLGVRIIPDRADEVGRLIRTFNRMGDIVEAQMTSLSRERERLSGVLDNIPDGVLILDTEGTVLLINPAGRELLGVDDPSIRATSLPQLVRDHRIVDIWRDSQRGHRGSEGTIEIGPRALRIISSPFQDGEEQGSLLILQDLTRLQRLEKIRRDFVSNISHELRTPLASLRALVETVRDSAIDDPPAARRFLDRIEIEVDALAQMVQELLELSRIESGQVPLQIQPTPIADFILTPVERLQAQAERAGVQLAVSISPHLPLLAVDGERMQQVITNFVHNAIKFTPSGGMIKVEASLIPNRPGKVLISVSDDGVGIPASALPRIFERFYKLDRARSSGGTGLGLAIAKHIVQAHGGEIWAESKEGEGSTLFCLLPAHPMDQR